MSVRDNPIPEATWPSAIRRALLPTVLFAVGMLADIPGLSWAAMGALTIGLVDGALPRRTFFPTLLMSAVFLSIAAGIAGFLSGQWWILLLLVPTSFIAGLLSETSFPWIATSQTVLVGTILFSDSPSTFGAAVVMAGWILFGGLLQMISSIFVWSHDRDASVRRALGVSLERLSRLVGSGVANDEQLAFVTASMNAEQTLSGARLPYAKNEHYANLISEINWTGQIAVEWLAAAPRAQSQIESVVEALKNVDQSIRISASRRSPADRDLDTVADRQTRELSVQLDRLSAAVEQPVPANNELDPESRADYEAAGRAAEGFNVRSTLASVISPSGWSQGTFRHAVRLAAAVGAGECLALAFTIDHGYWIPLTIALILRSDMGATLSRALLRVTGNLGAVATIGTVLLLAGNPIWLMIVLTFAAATLTLRWFTANYALAAGGLAGTVLVMLEAGVPDAEVLAMRLANVLIGGAIAVVAFLVVPNVKSQIIDLLTAMLTAHRDWISSVLSAYQDSATADLSGIQDLEQRARDSRLRARLGSIELLMEPRYRAAGIGVPLQLAETCGRVSTAVMALQATLRSPVARRNLDLAAMRERVIADFTSAIESLSSRDATQQIPPFTREQIPLTGDAAVNRALQAVLMGADSIATSARVGKVGILG